MITMNEIATAAQNHAANLTADIRNAATRSEHIRLTQLALEAERLSDDIQRFVAKDV